MGFACEEDARRVLEVLPKRFGKYGLTLHPDKTRLVSFAPGNLGADPQRQGGQRRRAGNGTSGRHHEGETNR